MVEKDQFLSSGRRHACVQAGRRDAGRQEAGISSYVALFYVGFLLLFLSLWQSFQQKKLKGQKTLGLQDFRGKFGQGGAQQKGQLHAVDQKAEISDQKQKQMLPTGPVPPTARTHPKQEATRGGECHNFLFITVLKHTDYKPLIGRKIYLAYIFPGYSHWGSGSRNSSRNLKVCLLLHTIKHLTKELT